MALRVAECLSLAPDAGDTGAQGDLPKIRRES